MSRLTLKVLPIALAIIGFGLVSWQIERGGLGIETTERPVIVAVSTAFGPPVCTSHPPDARISCISLGRAPRE